MRRPVTIDPAHRFDLVTGGRWEGSPRPRASAAGYPRNQSRAVLTPELTQDVGSMQVQRRTRSRRSQRRSRQGTIARWQDRRRCVARAPLTPESPLALALGADLEISHGD